MLRRTLLLTLVAGALVAPPAHAAGDPTMPLADVRIGMSCSVRSVVLGTDISIFDAHVDGILSDPREVRRSRILVTLSGAAVDATGVGPGFSGSPVICPGADGVQRIAGAISETVGSYGGRTVLVTPIQAIVGEPVDPPRQPLAAARAARIRAAARPLAVPLTIGGLDADLGALLQRAAKRVGRSVLLAPAASALAATPAPYPIVPGAAVAVGYATGDISAGAVGTVAYVDGDAVWAFGHPFESGGRRDLFLESAYVYGVVSNPVSAGDISTYKLAAPLGPIGVLRQDGVSAVAGRIGPEPDSFPLRITVRDLDSKRLQSSVSRLADERSVGFPNGFSALSTLAVPAVIDAIEDALGGSPVRQSADVCIRISVAQRKKALAFCNRYVGGGGDAEAMAAGPLAADISSATELLDVYDASGLSIRSVDIGVRVRRGMAMATLTSLRGPRAVRRGGVLTLRARMRRPGGQRITRMIKVPVPRTMPRGPRDVLLRGTDPDVSPTGADSETLDLTGLFEDDTSEEAPRSPSTVARLAKAISDMHRYDGVTARFVPTDAPAPQQLPGGPEGIAQRARRVFRDKSIRVSGRARWSVLVR
jgi:hypothetical protein